MSPADLCLPLLAIASLLSGCTTNGPGQPATDRPACCSDRAALPAPEPLWHSQRAAFTPQQPHLDMGSGPSPVLQYSLVPGSVRVIDVFMMPSSPASGSAERGTLYFAAPRFDFFDAAGQPIATPPPSRPYFKAWSMWVPQVLVFAVVVPPQAQRLLVSADRRLTGQTAESLATSPSMSYFIPLFPGGMTVHSGGSGQQRYAYTVHGEMLVNAFGAPQNPAIPQRKAP